MSRHIFDAAMLRAIRPLLNLALLEDLANGDVTSLTTIPADAQSTARLLAKADGIIAGMPVVELVLKEVDPEMRCTVLIEDGSRVQRGQHLAEISGCTRSILAAERTALNFLQRMSGIATATSSYVAAVFGTGAHIVDTRKTAPGHRLLDKYAVRAGGGSNHRGNLSDGVLIKDNHIAAVGGVQQAIRAARAGAPHTLKIECEVTSPAMARAAVDAGADIIMLDNMTLQEMHECVQLIGGHALTEASGGVTLDTVRAIAECGVDLISVGALTHSVIALDISLDIIV